MKLVVNVDGGPFDGQLPGTVGQFSSDAHKFYMFEQTKVGLEMKIMAPKTWEMLQDQMNQGQDLATGHKACRYRISSDPKVCIKDFFDLRKVPLRRCINAFENLCS